MVIEVPLEISCERVLFGPEVSADLLFIFSEFLVSACPCLFDLDFQEETRLFSIFCFLFLLVLNIHQVRVMSLQLVISVLLLLLFLS